MSRENLKKRFLQRQGWEDQPQKFLAGDCSFRRYYRLGSDPLRQVILMDAPPPEENLSAFVEIAQLLSGYGYSAPEVLSFDLEGFALLEDFGDNTFTQCLSKGAEPLTLYETAMDFLIDLHRKFKPSQHAGLPRYTPALYAREHDLFLEWYYVATLKKKLTPSMRQEWEQAWRTVLAPVEGYLPTLVLRDFHIDNLVFLADRKGPQRCGLLDFQDALIGPAPYDVVSLLEDARYDVPHDLQEKMLDRYLRAFPSVDPAEFYRAYFTLGAQRTTKIFGIFTRLALREKNSSPRYLPHLPRLWKWLQRDCAHPHLRPIKTWLDTYLPMNQRGLPCED